jgi:hypothetical protein
MGNDVIVTGDPLAASSSNGGPGKRIIFDTMLWNYIGDDGSIDRLLEAVDPVNWTFVHPPSILLEVLRSSDDRSREARVAAMITSGGERLTSEAELCVNELVNAIWRHRPRWFNKRVDMQTVNHYHKLWSEKIWLDAINNSREIHEWQNQLDPSIEDGRIKSQRLNKRFMERDNFNLEYSQVARSAPPYVRQFFGGTWDGTRVEAWRFDVGMLYWDIMIGRPGRDADTMRDWLESYIDARTATADSDEFRRLWFDNLNVSDVRRDWLRFAVIHTQTRFKIQDSNARDDQHCAYLVDADLFLSADRRLVNVLQKVRDQAPFVFAEPRLVKPTESSTRVDAIIAALA